jgi:hypothetical protein
MALQWIPSIRGTLLPEFIRNFDLTKTVDQNYLINLAKTNLEKKKMEEATNLLVRFKLFDHFDIPDVIMQIIRKGNKIGCVKQLINEIPAVLEDIVHRCSNKELHKTASQLVKDYRLDISKFPILAEI